jgi:predicted nucleic acid-binding protein
MGETDRVILVDTDVLIEFRRGDPRAVEWIASQGDVPLPIPGVVALEFVVGSRDGVELQRAKRFIGVLDVQWHDVADQALAYDLIGRYRLRTGLGLSDFLIAAQALNRKATLYSFNLKHFGAIEGLDIRAPYPR